MTKAKASHDHYKVELPPISLSSHWKKLLLMTSSAEASCNMGLLSVTSASDQRLPAWLMRAGAWSSKASLALVLSLALLGHKLFMEPDWRLG